MASRFSVFDLLNFAVELSRQSTHEAKAQCFGGFKIGIAVAAFAIVAYVEDVLVIGDAVALDVQFALCHILKAM